MAARPRLWPVPEPLLREDIDELTLRIEARTGLQMETGLAVSRLDGQAWRDRLERLGRLDPAAVRPDDDPAWHEPMALEAEQDGNAFAAIWHLDRLIAARPDDWSLHARRAPGVVPSHQFDRAAADYQQAERLGTREEVLDFQIHCVIDCTEAGRWAEALWYLDRLIAARPDDVVAARGPRGGLRQARPRGRPPGRTRPRLRAGCGRGARHPPGRGARPRRPLGRGRGLLARCGRAGPISRQLARAWGIACLKAGDRAGYREACAAIVARFGTHPTPVLFIASTAQAMALGIGDPDEDRAIMARLEKWLQAVAAPPRTNATRPRTQRHEAARRLGALLFRAGRIDEAIARLNEGLAASREWQPDGSPGDWVYQALAHARKGDLAEARRWLERLRHWSGDPRFSFWDIQELALLGGEAEALILDAGFPRDPFAAPGHEPLRR